MDGLASAALVAAALAVVPAFAEADCRCRGSDGRFFEHGELACIKTAKGPKLARCDMVLNNSSWTVLGEDCPAAKATPVPHDIATAALSFASAAPADVHHADVP